MTAREKCGTDWRVLTHRDGASIEFDSCVYPSTFDELVIRPWFHLEQMDVKHWWMNIAGVTVLVWLNKDGTAKAVDVYEPGGYDLAVPGVKYGGVVA